MTVQEAAARAKRRTRTLAVSDQGSRGQTTAGDLDGLIDCEHQPEWFHPYQGVAWLSSAKIVAILAGWQSGKTVVGAPWLRREIQRCGPGDYGVGAPTFRLMNKKVLPEVKACFKGLGTYNKTDFEFTFSEEGCIRIFGYVPEIVTKIYFGYAENPDSLESATYKAYWADECGQDKFKSESFETIKSRVMVQRGRILLTSRPYNFGWYKTEINDRADRKVYEDPRSRKMVIEEKNEEVHIEVISFPSSANPAQDQEAIAREERTMPAWKFLMKYGGMFTRPAGAIYDCFENKPELFSRDPDQPSETNVCYRFDIPADWPVDIGSDFGDNNTAALLTAAELIDRPGDKPEETKRVATGRHFAFGAYKKAGRTNEEHAWALRAASCGFELFLAFEDAYSRWIDSPLRTVRKQGEAPPSEIADVLARCYLHPKCVGGSRGEQGWRDAYQLGGLKISSPPIPKDTSTDTIVEIGITCGYGAIKERRIIFFSDIDEQVAPEKGPIYHIENYSRELDDEQEPTHEIKDKAKFHFADCFRYLAMKLFPTVKPKKLEVQFF